MSEEEKNYLLYPGNVSDALLKQVPPTAVWTSEFDFYKRDNLKYAQRLKAAGKLIDVSCMPGVTHGYQLTFFEPRTQENKWFYEEEKMAFDAFVRK